jgi:regulator of CtrA degradation
MIHNGIRFTLFRPFPTAGSSGIIAAMSLDDARKKMTARLVDSLYTEAMLLADEARSYFDEAGRPERDALGPMERVAFSCESLKVTTRLMHVIAWLLTRKGIASGEIHEDEGNGDSRRIGDAADSDPAAVEALPPGARAIVESSIDLYARVSRIDRGMTEPESLSPALGLLRRIERAL